MSFQDFEARLRPGDTVVFKGQTEDQRRWGGCSDASRLVIGRHYEVEAVDIHSWHTKISLKYISGRFNSACFGLASPQDKS